VLTNHSGGTRRLPGSILVTGASGFLGQHVCSALLAEGVAVRGLVRRPDGRLPPGVIPQLARGLDDLPALRQAIAGVEGVIHLAARVHMARSPSDTAAFREVNVEGTRSLLEASVATGVRDFVFVSTVKVMGETSDEPWTESTPPAPADAYGATKLEAERLVREVASRHGLHAPILRPPMVYGPGMRANALRLFQAIDRGLPLPLGGIRNRRSLLYVGNMTAALRATLTTEAGNDTFFVSDSQNISTSELVTAVARALGRPSRLVTVPVFLLRAAGLVGDLLARVRPIPVTSAAIDRLVGSLAVDSSKLARATGYSPPFSVAEGLRITADWYRTAARKGR
jgi:UDP-N-acetyl-alpha-D-quinovosamine dehydrogenase